MKPHMGSDAFIPRCPDIGDAVFDAHYGLPTRIRYRDGSVHMMDRTDCVTFRCDGASDVLLALVKGVFRTQFNTSDIPTIHNKLAYVLDLGCDASTLKVAWHYDDRYFGTATFKYAGVDVTAE